ncbi:MAG: hypothetical protein ACK5NT_10250 [Pyrinomonadaceae bacterium]
MSAENYKNDPNWKRFVPDFEDLIYHEWQCNECVHRFEPDVPMRCKAFPKGIPDEIFNREHDHREPFPGDGGIRFEKYQL